MSEAVRAAAFFLCTVSTFYWLYQADRSVEKVPMNFDAACFNVGLSILSLLACGLVAGVIR